MEIALSSFTPRFDSSTSAEANRQRQQQDAQRQASAGNNRAQENQRNQTRAESNRRTPPSAESVRVISGEVLSSETQRVDNRESSPALLSRSANQEPSGQPDNRRITSQRAIENFQENEELVPANNQQRQVSGIIDVFV